MANNEPDKGTERRAQTETEERRIDDPKAFILSRARSEVHLLLDNISANPEVTINSLAERNPPKGLPTDWIEEVCKITWPPGGGGKSEADLAEQAALLIKVRDYLNGLAKPASGATIAFTLMVTQEENLKSRRQRAVHDMSASPSRSSLACEAYPDLVPKARRFRSILTWMIWLPIGWLAFTLFVSWYLTIGNAALTDYAAVRTRLAEADANVSTAQSALTDPATSTRNSEQPPTTGSPPGPPNAPPQPPQASSAQTGGGQVTPSATAAGTPTTFLADVCGADIQAGSYPSAGLRDACQAQAEQKKSFDAIREGLDRWGLWAGPDTASWLANLLGSGVLQVLYGVLGAIAAVVRTLASKIKRSLLSPRDLQLSFQQLALGAVIGACISLFIATPGAPPADQTLLGPVALSTSAISFVAGFGVDSVFQALEALISRIFNIAPAVSAPRPDNRTTP